MSRSWPNGSTRAWRRIRQYVLDRDGHTCQLRLTDRCTGVATQAHHTLGRQATGDDPAFIVGSCASCNATARDCPELGVTDPEPRPVTKW
jgi:5-methylcytosine-specific restriction endonuclease McrA